jgi:hypothetical protein
MQEETLDARSKRLGSLSVSIDSSFLGVSLLFSEKLCFQHTFSLYDPNPKPTHRVVFTEFHACITKRLSF